MHYYSTTMKTKRKPSGGEPLVPLQFKTRPDIRAKLKVIATKNGLSLNDVGSMCLAAGVGMVEQKLREIHEPKAA